jgi:hypothetical protein
VAVLTLAALVFAWAIARLLLRRRRSRPRFCRKETTMSDLPNAAAEAPGAAEPAPVASADAQPALDGAKVVTSVVQTVRSHPDIHPSKAAGVITSILAGLYQAQPALFAVTRANSRTQAEVSLGLGLAEIIVGAFLHPGA